MKTKLKFYPVALAAVAAVTVGTAASGKPYLSARVEVTTKSGTVKRTVTAFNSKRNPQLIERLAAGLADGTVNANVVYETVGEARVMKVLNLRKA